MREQNAIQQTHEQNFIQQLKNSLPRTEFTREHEGKTLKCYIPPCCYIYSNALLQVEIAWGNEQMSVKSKALLARDAKVSDALELVATISFACCSTCGTETFNRLANIRPVVLCEKCRVEEINAEYRKNVAEEEQREKRQEAKLRAQGFTHKTVAWVHAGGDDTQIVLYTKGAPTDAQIKRELAKRGSRVMDDYSTTELSK